jgi:hypothetical protein
MVLPLLAAGAALFPETAKSVGNWVSDKLGVMTAGVPKVTKERQFISKPYEVDPNAFDPEKDKQYQDAMRAVQDAQGNAGQYQTAANTVLMQGNTAPQSAIAPVVNANSVVARTGAAESALGGAQGLMGNTQDSRAAQGGALDLVQQTATGQGPSVAPDMVRENAAITAADIQFNAQDALQAYGSAANNAGLAYGNAYDNAAGAYGDAFAAQQAAADQAAVNAQRQTMAAGEDAVRRQAAAAAGARGNNIGAALLQSQGDAAFTMAGAGQVAAQNQADAQRAASIQAAAAQRQADADAMAAGRQVSYNQATENASTVGVQNRADIASQEQKALGDYRAGQIASGEMLDAQGRLLTGTADYRAGDAVDVASQLGITDREVTLADLEASVAAGNADRELNADTVTANNTVSTNIANTSAAVDTNQQNMSGATTVAGNATDSILAGLGYQTDLAGQGFAAGMTLEEQQRLAEEEAMRRRLGFNQGVSDSSTKLIGSTIGAAGSIGAAALASDERAKDIGEDVDHDYRKAKSKRYTYKNPEKHGEGEFEGPMAQELPESVLEEDDEGTLKVNIGRLALSLASSVGSLQRKLDELEAA